MKTISITLLFLGLAICFSTCKKKSEENQTPSSTTLFSSTFNNSSDLSYWTQSAGGVAFIDSNAVKLDSITNCFQFETKNLIPVQAGKSYALNLTGKVNEAVQGDPMLCAGDFLIYIVQGNTNLLSTSFGNYPSWTQRAFSFTAITSASIKIKFLIGTTRGAWIDYISLIGT